MFTKQQLKFWLLSSCTLFWRTFTLKPTSVVFRTANTSKCVHWKHFIMTECHFLITAAECLRFNKQRTIRMFVDSNKSCAAVLSPLPPDDPSRELLVLSASQCSRFGRLFGSNLLPPLQLCWNLQRRVQTCLLMWHWGKATDPADEDESILAQRSEGCVSFPFSHT